MTSNKLADYLNQLLDVSSFDDVCPNGIQVTNNGEITKICTAVSASLETIQKIIQAKANALIVHHGIFKVKDTVILEGTLYQKVELLLEHNIALLCYHLPLDAHQTIGNNWKVARDLGWQNLQPFGDYNKMLIGVQGTFSTISLQEFVQQLENYYGHSGAIVPAKETIQSAAIISGGAHKFINQAIAAGVDCFITGTTDEPIWDIAQENNIAFAAFGHAATEKVGPKALANYVQETLKIPSEFIDTENPF